VAEEVGTLPIGRVEIRGEIEGRVDGCRWHLDLRWIDLEEGKVSGGWWRIQARTHVEIPEVRRRRLARLIETAVAAIAAVVDLPAVVLLSVLRRVRRKAGGKVKLAKFADESSGNSL
jgi:hypothetical protein